MKSSQSRWKSWEDRAGLEWEAFRNAPMKCCWNPPLWSFTCTVKGSTPWSAGKPGKLVEIPEGQRKSLCTAVWAPSFGCGRSIPPNYDCWTCGWEHFAPKIHQNSVPPSFVWGSNCFSGSESAAGAGGIVDFFYFWPPLAVEAEEQNSTAFGAIMCHVPSRHRWRFAATSMVSIMTFCVFLPLCFAFRQGVAGVVTLCWHWMFWLATKFQKVLWCMKTFDLAHSADCWFLWCLLSPFSPAETLERTES